MKRCAKCKRRLGDEHFASCYYSPDRLQTWCRRCKSEYVQKPTFDDLLLKLATRRATEWAEAGLIPRQYIKWLAVAIHKNQTLQIPQRAVGANNTRIPSETGLPAQQKKRVVIGTSGERNPPTPSTRRSP